MAVIASDRRRKLTRSFYSRATIDVARELIGKHLVRKAKRGEFAARIVEVEAYVGEEDPACHAACGPTERNRLMYGTPGIAYIYFIYGMYYCLNVVTEKKGFPAAVLIRAAEPISGFDQEDSSHPHHAAYNLLSGPGKLCRAFGLTRKQNGLDLTGTELYLEDRHDAPPRIKASTRIGIRQGAEKLWRFFDAESPAVSHRRAGTKITRITGKNVR